MSGMLRRLLLAIGFVSAGLAAAQEARLELLYVDRAGCPWCARFEQDVLPGYPHSDIGKTAPMRRASLDAGQPGGVVLGEPVRFTPTFVLLRDGRETGRIVGYQDNATFYGLMERLLAGAPGKTEAQR